MRSTEQAQPDTITEHLRRYGIRTFTTDAYWDWACERMGRRKAAQVDRLRASFSGDGPDDPAAMQTFYNFIADPAVLGPVASKQADDIAQGLKSVTAVTAGRTRILDLGCGAGYLSTWLALQDVEGRQVVGIDFSARMVKEASRYASRLDIGNVSFVHGDVGTMLPDGPFDAVIDAATLQYVDDRTSVLQRLRERMAPDGILVSVPQLGRARDAVPFLATLTHAGFSVRSFSFVYASDLGRGIARPLIVAGIGGESLPIDLRAEFDRAGQTLASTAILPLSQMEIPPRSS